MLFLEDNFTFHPLSSETLLKVPACHYEQKSSVNAEMLYPLLLPPCHHWILKHSVIKKENMCWECSIPFQQQALCAEETPVACTVSATPHHLPPCFSKPWGFGASHHPCPLCGAGRDGSASLGGQGRCHSEGQGKPTSCTSKHPNH